MSGTASSLINIYVFSTGRRLFALHRVRETAVALGLPHIVEHIDRAIAHDRHTQALELRAEAAPTALFGPDAQALDPLLDQSIVGFVGYLESQIRIYGADSERGAAAAAVLQATVPSGPGAITMLPFVQENQAVEGMLARLAEPDLAALVAKLPDLPAIVAQIRNINTQYGAALTMALARRAPSSDELREQRSRGQDLLAELVALILAHFAGKDDDGSRAELLAPILAQNHAIRQARRRNRKPGDIDSDTGAEMPGTDPGEPATDHDIDSPVA